jgi:hypothetical protein
MVLAMAARGATVLATVDLPDAAPPEPIAEVRMDVDPMDVDPMDLAVNGTDLMAQAAQVVEARVGLMVVAKADQTDFLADPVAVLALMDFLVDPAVVLADRVDPVADLAATSIRGSTKSTGSSTRCSAKSKSSNVTAVDRAASQADPAVRTRASADLECGAWDLAWVAPALDRECAAWGDLLAWVPASALPAGAMKVDPAAGPKGDPVVLKETAAEIADLMARAAVEIVARTVPVEKVIADVRREVPPVIPDRIGADLMDRAAVEIAAGQMALLGAVTADPMVPVAAAIADRIVDLIVARVATAAKTTRSKR